MLTKKKSNNWDLRRSQVWGCPVYVLESNFQNNQKLLKWNWRSRLEKFIGFPEEHSTLVANVRHLQTGYTSPQCHLFFDDLFKTAFWLGDNDPVIGNICNELFDSGRDWYAEEWFDSVGQLIYCPPPLSEVWINEHRRCERKEELGK